MIKVEILKYFDLYEFNQFLKNQAPQESYFTFDYYRLVQELLGRNDNDNDNDESLAIDVLSSPKVELDRVIDTTIDDFEVEEYSSSAAPQEDATYKIISLILKGVESGSIKLTEPNLIRNFIYYYDEMSKDSRAIDAIVYLINNYIKYGSKSEMFGEEEERENDEMIAIPFNPFDDLYGHSDVLKQIIPRVPLSEEYISLTSERYRADLQKLYAASKVMDTALGLRQAGLPPYIVENIASHAYDTSAFSLYQMMNMITPVIEYKKEVEAPAVPARKKVIKRRKKKT